MKQKPSFLNVVLTIVVGKQTADTMFTFKIKNKKLSWPALLVANRETGLSGVRLGQSEKPEVWRFLLSMFTVHFLSSVQKTFANRTTKKNYSMKPKQIFFNITRIEKLVGFF